MPTVYILRCADHSFYVGQTRDMKRRLERHERGEASAYTAKRLPVRLVYTEELNDQRKAVQRERQLKRWSRAKKAALIEGDRATLKALSRCRSRTGMGGRESSPLT